MKTKYTTTRETIVVREPLNGKAHAAPPRHRNGPKKAKLEIIGPGDDPDAMVLFDGLAPYRLALQLAALVDQYNAV
jgi:hypothetical protein